MLLINVFFLPFPKRVHFSVHFGHPRIFSTQKAKLSPSLLLVHVLPAVALGNVIFLAVAVRWFLVFMCCCIIHQQVGPGSPHPSQGTQVLPLPRGAQMEVKNPSDTMRPQEESRWTLEMEIFLPSNPWLQLKGCINDGMWPYLSRVKIFNFEQRPSWEFNGKIFWVIVYGKFIVRTDGIF